MMERQRKVERKQVMDIFYGEIRLGGWEPSTCTSLRDQRALQSRLFVSALWTEPAWVSDPTVDQPCDLGQMQIPSPRDHWGYLYLPPRGISQGMAQSNYQLDPPGES